MHECMLVPHLILIGYVFYKHILKHNKSICHLFEVVCSKFHLIHEFSDVDDSEHENSLLFE